MQEVKIIGLELKKSMGILKAHKLVFDQNNNLIIFKGQVGSGKTTEQKAIQLGTQGSKTLTDKKLYGEIDNEIELLDGETNIWVGCKSDATGSLIYSLYTKDSDGKIVRDPVIDGVKATPAKYLEKLQTELTWRMDELTSENPTVQRNILLELYRFEMEQKGVIFDRKHPNYNDTILGQIEQAENDRNEKDMIRKQYGGIKEDLLEKGFDPDRPQTIPDEVDLSQIDAEIMQISNEKYAITNNAEGIKNEKLSQLKLRGSELTNKLIQQNADNERAYNQSLSQYNDVNMAIAEIDSIVSSITSQSNELVMRGALSNKDVQIIIDLLSKVNKPETIKKPEMPYKVNIVDGVVKETEDHGNAFLKELLTIRSEYMTILEAPVSVDTSALSVKMDELIEKKKRAEEINKIVKAVDSFHAWRQSNEDVVRLKNEYVKTLTSIDTGIEGLKIVPDENDIFLMYDGSYDPAYFGNPEKEPRKVSAYSGTQKPIICLLIQNYMLNKKPKAMRYMYIDNVPMDKKSIELLDQMCQKLNLRIFLNITGDFDRSELKNGEILIEGGEVIFN